MKTFQADYLYTPEGWRSGAWLTLDDRGRVLSIGSGEAPAGCQRLRGILCPGFVNAHCHLELSALRGKIPPGSGMAGFIRTLVEQRREIPPEAFAPAAEEALAQALAAGTAAFGDICNTGLTAELKARYPHIYFWSFLEVLGLDESQAEARLEAALELAGHFAGHPHSLSPHAPYSLSPKLMALLAARIEKRLSVHLLESPGERELLASGGGELGELFRQMKLPLPKWPEAAPLAFLGAHLPQALPWLLVHNTEIQAEEIRWLIQHTADPWFCICPRSSEYIHRRPPPAELLMRHTDRICIGTDSLASNDRLDPFAEVCTLLEQFPQISLHQALRWATTGGAQALGLFPQLGSFEPGTAPGLLLIEEISEDLKPTQHSRVSLLEKPAIPSPHA
jgi:cytosine/adenosine deaminase-related metal-dependent hydrolase